MVRTVLAHVRAQWMGALALFLVIAGGTAYAANTIGSSDIINESILSQDVKNGEVQSADVANGSLHTADIGNRAVNSAKVADASLTGDDVAESTLDQVPSAALGGIGRSAVGGHCDPEGTAFLSCAFTTILLPAPTRMLVIGSVKAQPEAGADNGTGQCRLATNNGPITVSGLTAVGRNWNDKFVPLMGIVDVGAGPLDFGIECNELDGYLNFFDAHVIAVALSPS